MVHTSVAAFLLKTVRFISLNIDDFKNMYVLCNFPHIFLITNLISIC